MRIRSLLSSVAVIGLFVAGASFTGDAQAQKGAIMAPSTSWAVTKIDNSAGPYCAMARTFNRNTVLTIAQNEDFETSFALNFQRTAFSAANNLNVILDPGAGQQRAYNVTPISPQAFVVKLGRDDSFFKALDRTGLLRVEAGGQAYHFNVSDIDVGQSRLDACVANLILPAAGEEELPPIESASAAPNNAAIDTAVTNATQTFRREINGLRRQISRLQEDNTSLRTRLENDENSSLEVSASVAQLSAQMRELEDEKIMLQRQLAEARAVQPPSETAKIVALKAENLDLRREIENLNAIDTTALVVQLEDEIQSLKSRNATLQAAAASVSNNAQSDNSSVVAALEAQVQQLESENAKLDQQIASLNSNAVEPSLLDQLREQIASVENENRLLQQTAAQSENALREKLAAENAAQAAALQEQIAVLKADDAQRSTEFAAAEELNVKIQELQSGNNDLQQQVAALEAEQAQREAELVQVGDMSAQVQSLQEDNEALKAQITALETQEADSVDAQVALLQKENTELKAQITATQTQEETSEGRLAELSAQRDELKSTLADILALTEGFKADNAEKAERISVLEAENVELQSALDTQTARADDAEEQVYALRVAAKDAETNSQQVEKESTVVSKEPSVVFAAPVEAKPEKIVENAQRYDGEDEKTVSVAKEAKEQRVARVDTPAPARKPSVPSYMRERVAEADVAENGVPQDDSTFAHGPRNAQEAELFRTIMSLENEIRSTPPEDQERLQTLVREHSVLIAAVEEGRAKAVATETSEPVIEQDMISDPTPDLADVQDTVEPEYAALEGLNEAQRLEQSYKASQEQVVSIEPVEKVEEIASAVSRSENPFEGIVVENKAEEIAQKQLIEPVISAQEDVKEELTMASTGASSPLKQLIAASNVSSVDKIKRVEKTSENYSIAYQWNGGSIYGSAEQKPISNPAQFDQLVMEYLERTEQRCPGEFAVVPDNTMGGGDMRADSYEVACVSESVSSGASLLFFNQGDEFVIVAHEAPAAELNAAINNRNQIIKTLVEGS